MAIVYQDDLLFEALTPRELITFSAQLRLPRTMTKEEKDARVASILTRLRLSDCADTKVGMSSDNSEARGLSGGERKRCAIGYEMVTEPKLLVREHGPCRSSVPPRCSTSQRLVWTHTQQSHCSTHSKA